MMFITFNQFKTALLAVKRYITVVMPKRVSDLVNDSGFITSAVLNINVTFDGNTYTGDKTFQEITDAIASSKIPQVICDGCIYKLISQYSDEYNFESVVLVSPSNEYHEVITVTNTNDWSKGGTYVTIPQNVSDLTNDAGYLTSETDPTVPAWAKEATKPTYTAAEVGALPADTAIPDNVFIATYGSTTYEDTLAAYNAGKLIFGVYSNSANGKLIIPLTRYVSNNYFQFEGKYLVGRGQRITLYLKTTGWSNEIRFGDTAGRSAAIESGDSFIIRDANDNGVMKYSTLTFGADTSTFLANNGTWQTPSYPVTSVNGSTGAVTISIPENVSDLTNDAGYLTSYTETDPTVPSWAKAATKPTYTASEVGALPDTTVIPDISGKVDKAGDTMTGNLQFADGIGVVFNRNADTLLNTSARAVRFVINGQSGAGETAITNFVFSVSGSSSNPLVSIGGIANPSGDYYVTNKKYVDDKFSALTIPTKTSDLTNDAGYLTSYTETDPTVPSWAKAETKPTYTASEVGAATNTHTHGNITNAGDITATATIANGDRLVINDESASRVTNSSITFGTGTTTFLANNGTWQTPSGAVTSVNGSTGAVNLTIPTKVSDLTNDSGFITTASIPQSDWAQNDTTANDYVKNRVCYSEDPVDTTLFQHTETLSGSTQIFGDWETQTAITLADGNPYTLSLDGNTYTGTIFLDPSYGWVCGNFYIINSEADDTGEPFCITISTNDGQYGGTSGNWAMTLAEAYTGTISLEFDIGEIAIHTLDDKYLNGALLKKGAGDYSVLLNGDDNYANLSADGSFAVAQGQSTSASGQASHAEGVGSSASGSGSHAEGNSTISSGLASHAEGYGTIANHKSQHASGEYNIADPSQNESYQRGTYIEIVGNGDYSTRSNARTLDWNGNEVLAGKLTVGAAPTANMDVATKQYVDTAVAGSGSAVTYTLSITNNVITLTGSDGSTSSVTLPVYAGGVSS